MKPDTDPSRCARKSRKSFIKVSSILLSATTFLCATSNSILSAATPKKDDSTAALARVIVVPWDKQQHAGLSSHTAIYLCLFLMLNSDSLKAADELALKAELIQQIKTYHQINPVTVLKLADLHAKRGRYYEAMNCLVLVREQARLVSKQRQFGLLAEKKMEALRAEIGTTYDTWNKDIPISASATTTTPIPLAGMKSFVGFLNTFATPMKSMPSMAELWLERGKILMSYGLYQQAAEDFIAAKNKMPGDERSLVSLGICYYNMQDISQTLWCAQSVLSLNPYSPEGHGLRALGLIDQPERALHAADKAIQLAPNVSWFYVTRARIREEKFRDWKKAIEDCNTALKLTPDDMLARLFRAKAQIELGEPQKAIDDCSQILHQQPVYYEAYRTRAQALRKLGKDKEAERDEESFEQYRKKLKELLAGGSSSSK